MKYEEDTAFWHLEAWAWMVENFGGFRKFSNTRLNPIDLSCLSTISPTDRHEKFEILFERVKESMGMSDWPCKFESLESVEEIQTFLDDRRDQGEGEFSNEDPAGMFAQGDDGEVSIYYSRLLAERPAALLSTIVHELCHYLFTTAKEAPPSGWENHEYYTDAAVVFAGYGVFACNSAFEFEQYTDGIMGGWGYNRNGYLGEMDLAYSLGIFILLRELDPKPILKMLKPNPRAYLKAAIKNLKKKRSILNEIKFLEQI